MKRLAPVLAGLFLLLGGHVARAHEVTVSRIQMRLEPAATRISVQLPLAALLHLPSPLPAATAEPALRDDPLAPAVQASIRAMLAERLSIEAGGVAAPLVIETVRAAGADLAVTATAPPLAEPLRVRVRVRADLFPDDPLAKVFVNVFRGDALVGQYALDRQDPVFTLGGERPVWAVVATFVREGVRHIFIGPDHILFVLALVLLGGGLWARVRIVTAFTIAHSITLALATLGLVQAPARLVESVIALSVVVVGLHDLWRIRRPATPGARDPRVLFAFVFGLVHGFGFASVLAELELPRQALAWSLAAFNIGVEIGQVAIVLAAAPLLAALHRHASPRVEQAVLAAGAGLVALTGAVWLWERALGA